MTSVTDLATNQVPTWCPGCGDFMILSAIKSAISELNLAPEKVAVISGIGCGSKTPRYIKTYGYESIHGRPIAVATGVKLANHEMEVMAVAGDGDTYGIGGNHFVHNCRRNMDITAIVQNNAIYGLTKGQTSPTSEHGFKTASTPWGVLEEAFNPIAIAIAARATFVSRGFAVDLPHLKGLIKQAIEHRGFALVDILQPCTSFNKINTADWYKQRVYKLEAEGHNPEDKNAAFAKSQEWGDRIPIGVFYRERRETYCEGIEQLKKGPLVKADLNNIDMTKFLEKFR